MEKDVILREIERIRDIKNHLWTALVVSVSGTLALMFSLNTILKSIFFIIGISASFTFINAYFTKDNEHETLINKLKE